MPPRRKKPDPELQKQLLAKFRGEQETRQKGYREQALAIFPHVCGRCGREHSGVMLRELTVHHKDNNHMNNPPDGRNWELLCIYCHGDEHEEYGKVGGSVSDRNQEPTLGHQPFAGLGDLLKQEDDESKRD